MPIGTLVGSSDVIVGWFGATVSVTGDDAAEPGFVTVIGTLPAVVITVVWIVAVSCDDETKFVS